MSSAELPKSPEQAGDNHKSNEDDESVSVHGDRLDKHAPHTQRNKTEITISLVELSIVVHLAIVAYHYHKIASINDWQRYGQSINKW